MNQELKLTPDMVPASFVYCFFDDCPLAGTCLRAIVTKTCPPQDWNGNAVFPKARQGNTCRLYKKMRVIRAAYGFSTLFNEVKAKEASYMRCAVQGFLGGKTTYYRYHHGERLLTPEQQNSILDFFRKQGYTQELHFDVYKDIYDFSPSNH